MSTQQQERLLPGTRSLPRATVAWEGYRGKELVRFRAPDGTTYQYVGDSTGAWQHWLKWTAALRGIYKGESDG